MTIVKTVNINGSEVGKVEQAQLLELGFRYLVTIKHPTIPDTRLQIAAFEDENLADNCVRYFEDWRGEYEDPKNINMQDLTELTDSGIGVSEYQQQATLHS